MMKWHTIKYLCKEGFLGIWKNRLMALASAGTIVLCLLILGLSYSFANNITYIMHQIETEMGIVAYVDEDTDAMRINDIKRTIRDLPYVVEVDFISKEDALKNFAMSQENDELFQEFQLDNPLPASFEIKVSQIEEQKNVVEAMKSIPELQVEYFENETNMFFEINQSVQMISTVMILSLIVIALLLITNTIKLTVYVRRREINIMKYIGATDSFIRLPFLIEGVVIGIIGAAVPMWMMYNAYNWAVDFLSGSLRVVFGGLTLQPVELIMNGLIPIFCGLGIGIGVVGSAIAIHRHLKV
ncbi:MAG: permease-like cell division protein FtsX [Cellulosilyticaceae bacterium]